MSSFNCEKCGTPILDSPSGYLTECEHYPFETVGKFTATTNEELAILIAGKGAK